MSQDRATFQQLAEMRLAEARLLLDNGLSSGAYYLAGYAIECALKAVIAKDFRENEIPDLKYVRDVHTHDLSALLRLAELEEKLDAEKKNNPEYISAGRPSKPGQKRRAIRFGRRPTRRLYWTGSAAIRDSYNGCGIAGRIKT
jgi:HEPN domain-containing protein